MESTSLVDLSTSAFKSLAILSRLAHCAATPVRGGVGAVTAGETELPAGAAPLAASSVGAGVSVLSVLTRAAARLPMAAAMTAEAALFLGAGAEAVAAVAAPVAAAAAPGGPWAGACNARTSPAATAKTPNRIAGLLECNEER